MAKKPPQYEVKVKVVLIADVLVTGGTLEEAIAMGKTWGLGDIVKLDRAVTEDASAVSVIAAWSQEDWGI